jgi:hypothetical protein
MLLKEQPGKDADADKDEGPKVQARLRVPNKPRLW